MKILGIVNSQGNYQGRDYHNLVLHVSYKDENPNKDCQGVLVDTVKLRYSDLNAILNMGIPDPKDVEKMQSADFSHLIGKEIEVNYNKFGGVQSVKLPDTNDKKS